MDAVADAGRGGDRGDADEDGDRGGSGAEGEGAELGRGGVLSRAMAMKDRPRPL